MANSSIIGSISIPEQYLEEILNSVGFPVIPLSELELSEDPNATDKEKLDNLKNLVIWPSMREYFKWFPIPRIVEYMAEETFTLDFPTQETFCVVDARLNTAGFGVRDSVNPFVNNSVYRAINTTSSYGGGIWGTKYDYNYREARLYDRMERQSLIDTNKALKIRVDQDKRLIEGFSNIIGKLVITWGELSYNFNQVDFRKVDEVINLCKANLMEYLGMLRGQQQSGLPSAFNFQLLLDKSEKIKEKVIGKWRKVSKISILRG